MKHFSTILIVAGAFCILIGLSIFIATFYQTIFLEAKYFFTKPNSHAVVSTDKKNAQAIHPVDSDFGIVIPKIGANAKIIPNVDPYNSYVYQIALTKGVAQAKGTALPYEMGNMFLFSHSAANFYVANQYNAIFYLLSKLTTKDTIYIYYKNQKYTYEVTKSLLVESSHVEYLQKSFAKHTLTLMTCWPPGTSWKRLLIIAQQI